MLLNLQPGLTTAGFSTNQQNVGNALNNFFNGGGSLTPSFLTAFALTGGNLQAALTQLSGEVATAPQQATFNAMTQFLGVMSDPTINGRGNSASAGGSVSSFADAEAFSYAARDKSRSQSEREAYAAMARKAPPRIADAMQRWNVWGTGFEGTPG